MAQVDVQVLRAEQGMLRAALEQREVPQVKVTEAAAPPVKLPALPELGLERSNTCPESAESKILLGAPPGLSLPPGLEVPAPSLLRAATVPSSAGKSSSEGITLKMVETESGSYCERAEWRIAGLRQKLKSCMGRPLVSPPFQALGLANLRLMVFPDPLEASKGLRTRKQKEQYMTMVTQGPLHSALRFKAAGACSVLTFRLSVGDAYSGPLTYDFSEHAVHGCEDFGINWLDKVDGSGSLTVGVELLDIQSGPINGCPVVLDAPRAQSADCSIASSETDEGLSPRSRESHSA